VDVATFSAPRVKMGTFSFHLLLLFFCTAADWLCFLHRVPGTWLFLWIKEQLAADWDPVLSIIPLDQLEQSGTNRHGDTHDDTL
jgi:hypothetical protein